MNISSLSPILAFAASLASQYKYLLVFIGVAIEGPLLMIACGFLVKLGIFSLVPVYIVAVLADLFADIVWYWIGHYFAKPFLHRFGKFVGLKKESLEKAALLFHKYHSRVLLISKVTLGFGLALAVVIFAGISRVNFKKFLILNAVGETILVAAMLFLGYSFGTLYSYISEGFRTFFLIGGILFILALTYGASRYVKESFAK